MIDESNLLNNVALLDHDDGVKSVDASFPAAAPLAGRGKGRICL